MQICILTIGTRGDVQPYLALGLGLKAAGYQVRIAAAPNFEGFIRGYELDFAPIGPDFQALMASESARKMLDRGGQPGFKRGQAGAFRQAFEQCASDAPGACRGSDAVIFSSTAFPLFGAAEQMRVPAVWAAITPMSRTSAFPSFFLSPKSLGRVLNGWSHRLGEQLMWQPFRGFINRWRQSSLGISPIPFNGPFDGMARNRVPVLYGYSSHVIPKPADWADYIHVTGYWFLDRAPGWQPPAALVDFLQAGPPPVYIGFGSMTHQNPEEVTSMMVKALSISGQRGVIASNWGEWGGGRLPDSVYLVDTAPHDWLFPQMAAVVHHGGAGTTAAGLRAGIPSILTPFSADQPFWAQRVYELGVGPKPVLRRRLTAEGLAGAITQAVTDQKMQACAAALGERIHAEDGVRNAVQAIENLLRE